MDDKEEQAYITGEKAAWRHMLGECLRHLGTEGDAERWRLERLDTIAMLRQVCADYGDNDWEDTLHLADIIEKHLYRLLDQD